MKLALSKCFPVLSLSFILSLLLTLLCSPGTAQQKQNSALRIAPNFVARDFDGVRFELKEHLGKGLAGKNAQVRVNVLWVRKSF